MFFLKNFIYAFRKTVLRNIFLKLFFLLKFRRISGSKFNIFAFFIKFWISETIIKKNSSLIKDKMKFYNEKYIFHEDWFSSNIPIWELILKKELNRDKQIEYLEIGSYEGRSTVYICEEFKKFSVTAVDPYLQYDEIKKYVNENNMEKKYNIFQKNISLFKNKVKFFRLSSDNFFKQNKFFFDVIYIDGSHFADDVKKDFIQSVKILNKNGLIIFDDFMWDHYNNMNENPISGILPLLENYPDLKVIFASEQLIVKKMN